MGGFFRQLSRVLLAGLLLFEFLNLTGLIRFGLTFTWLGLLLTCLFIWLMLEVASYLFKRNRIGQFPGLAFLAATVVIYIDALGDIFKLYGQFDCYDRIAHLAGGGAAAAVVFAIIFALNRSGRIALPRIGQLLFAFFAAAFLGIVYELEEYFEDLLTGSGRLGDGFDTANDLLFDLTGALIVLLAILGYFYLKREKPPSAQNKHPFSPRAGGGINFGARSAQYNGGGRKNVLVRASESVTQLYTQPHRSANSLI